MAITGTYQSGASVAGQVGDTISTSSYAFDGYYLVATAAWGGAGNPVPGQPTLTTPTGVTDTHIRTQDDGSESSLRSLSVFLLTGTGTDVLTADWGMYVYRAFIYTVELAGHDTTGTVVQSSQTNATGDGAGLQTTAALSSFSDATNNAVFAFFHNFATGTYTQESGYTLLTTATGGDRVVCEYDVGEDLTTDITFSVASATYNAIALEINAASTRSAALTGTITSATESDIVTGGETIIVTLTGDTLIPA